METPESLESSEKKKTNTKRKLASEGKKMLHHQTLKGANQRQGPKAENHLH